MRDADTHVFIDCGPVGLAGRGGHGHNDALSFEAWLAGVPLVIDCGSYVYTASFAERNRFRSTDCHNTPRVDGEEINRFDPGNLWYLRDEARPVCRAWQSDEAADQFVGTHQGYRRLGVEVQRTIRFDKAARRLDVIDALTGAGEHAIAIPLHFAPGVAVEASGAEWRLSSRGRHFALAADPQEGWSAAIEASAVSPSYGVVLPAQRLVWRRQGPLPATLKLSILPLPAGG